MKNARRPPKSTLGNFASTIDENVDKIRRREVLGTHENVK